MRVIKFNFDIGSIFMFMYQNRITMAKVLNIKTFTTSDEVKILYTILKPDSTTHYMEVNQDYMFATIDDIYDWLESNVNNNNVI
jgi:hypothetical protein